MTFQLHTQASFLIALLYLAHELLTGARKMVTVVSSDPLSFMSQTRLATDLSNIHPDAEPSVWNATQTVTMLKHKAGKTHLKAVAMLITVYFCRHRQEARTCVNKILCKLLHQRDSDSRFSRDSYPPAALGPRSGRKPSSQTTTNYLQERSRACLVAGSN